MQTGFSLDTSSVYEKILDYISVIRFYKCIPIFGNYKVLLSLSLVFHFSIAYLIT